MKRMFFAMLAVASLAACTTGTPASEEVTVDSTEVVVDTTCADVDTTAVDTTVVAE